MDTAQRLQHTIHFADEATPDNKKKPRGVMGAEIFLKLGGPPPVDSSECIFLTIDSKTPYVAHFTGEDAGKMAHTGNIRVSQQAPSAWWRTWRLQCGGQAGGLIAAITQQLCTKDCGSRQT